MKALVKFAKGPGNVELRDIEEPPCGPNQVKLEVAWCGVCGTDLHVVHDTFRNFPPVVLGHEIAASIVETGKNVSRPENRRQVLHSWSHCRYLRPLRLLPPRPVYVLFERRGMGHGVNGAFTRFVVVRPDQLFPLVCGRFPWRRARSASRSQPRFMRYAI